MELRQLEALVAIVRLGGFRRAAEHLLISQPALSQQIQSLEAELGLQLFERGRRPVSLTQAGEVLLTRAQQMLWAAGATRREMREFVRLQRGYVRVGTVSSDGAPWVPSLLATFHRSCPEITIDINQFTSIELVGLLVDREIDLACLSLPGRHVDLPEGLQWACVGIASLAFAVPPQHRLAGRSDVRLEELAHERLIVPSQSTITVVVEHAFRERGLAPPPMLNIGDQSLLLQFAAIGLGIGLSSRAKMADFAHLELWPVEPVDARLEITGAAVWAESGLRNPAVQAFVNGVKQWLATCEGSELGFAGLRPAASD